MLTDASAQVGSGPRGIERAEAVADAVLYEGYLLYPYRRSSGKHRIRWQFGVLAPKSWIESSGPVDDGVAGSAESWYQQAECLLEAPDDATVHVRVRFLHLESRIVERRSRSGRYRPTGAVEVDGETRLAFDEGIPHDLDVAFRFGDLVRGEVVVPIEVSEGGDVESLHDADGAPLGRVLRRHWPVAARLVVSAERVDAPFRLHRLRVRTENVGDPPLREGTRDEALRYSLLAAHALVALDRGGFLSLLDPPEWAAPAAAGCVNIRVFPVLAGEQGRRDLVLSSPIILYDHPQVAPESPGDLFDATEIDEILSLRTLTLSDDEKREARATDPRAAAIVDRVDAMEPELLGRLHGAVRSLRPVGRVGGDACTVVDGVELRRGSRVRLRPRRRGTDAHDMFLAGRTAVVEAVLADMEDGTHLAVTVDDDPAAELHQWYGRFHYFAPEEVEPLGPGAGEVP